MIHTIVLWYNMMRNISGIVFNCIKQNENRQKNHIYIFAWILYLFVLEYVLLIKLIITIWLNAFLWPRHVNIPFTYVCVLVLITVVNLIKHLSIAFYRFFSLVFSSCFFLKNMTSKVFYTIYHIRNLYYVHICKIKSTIKRKLNTFQVCLRFLHCFI